MTLIRIEKEPGPAFLRAFAALFVAFFGLAGAAAFWRHGAATSAYVLWSIGIVVGGTAFFVPRFARRVYLGWMYALFPFGWVLSVLLLAFVYYAVLTPIALLRRRGRADPLDLHGGGDGWWIEREPTVDPQRYFRQY